MPQTGKILIEWERRDENPVRYDWTMRCEPPLSLEETTAICEQIATDHRDLLDGRDSNP
jgi:hypothetical protein